jgi:hypothetical protein
MWHIIEPGRNWLKRSALSQAGAAGVPDVPGLLCKGPILTATLLAENV